MLTSNRMNGLHPYVPGEQPKDRVYIKLNANENPYPPSKEVTKAVVKFVKQHPDKLGLYPDPDSNDLHAAIADMLNKTGGVLCRAKVDVHRTSLSMGQFKESIINSCNCVLLIFRRMNSG